MKKAAPHKGSKKPAKKPAKKPTKKAPKTAGPASKSSPKMFNDAIKANKDWRGETLAKIRAVIQSAVPGVVEELKWRGVPVWSSNGILTTGETYKSVVKMTFAKGASLKDPAKLFNSSLEGNTRRAIDFKEGEKINEKALKALVQEAAALNASGKKK